MESRPYPPCGEQFSQRDFDRVVSETCVTSIDYHPELDSTNDRALELTRDVDFRPAPMLILTDHQTAGRGRGENSWWSGSGALTFSLLLSNEQISLPPANMPVTSLVTGLAVAYAIEQVVSGETTRLKWPNDVYLRGRKVCGILVEAIGGRRRAVVIGIGVNANNSVAEAPDELRRTSIALCDVVGRAVDRTELLVAILQHFESQIGRLRSGDSRLQKQWQDRCLLTGQTIHVETANEQLIGTCRGIDEQGALLLEVGARVERCLAGVVKRVY